MSGPTTIDYATPIAVPPPASVLRVASLVLSGIAGGVGVLILLAYVVIEVEGLLFAGFIWLGLGGLLAFVAFVLGTIYAIQAFSRRFPPPATRWQAAVAVLAPLLTLPVAFGCMAGGIAWADRVASRVVIVNDSGAPIDRVDLIDGNGTQPLGPLPAGRSVSGYVRHDGGSTSVAFTRGGETTTYEVDSYHFAVPGGSSRRVAIDAAGVVTRRDGHRAATPEVLSPTTEPSTMPAGR